MQKEQVSQDYKCSECKDQGIKIKIKNGYEVAIPCKCKIKEEATKRISNSGIENLLKTKTFKSYIAKEPFQKAIKEKAMAFTKEFIEGNRSSFAILGQSGCVDSDTEYFNGNEWVKISNYKDGKVLQYNPKTKEATLVKPSNYISVPSEKLYKIETLRGSINQVLSSNHNFAYITSKGNMRKKNFGEVMDLHKKNIQGFYGKVETAFNYGSEGIKLSEQEIRLMVAVIGDGSFRKDLKLCSINIKKDRKINRLKKILQGIDYKEYKKSNGFTEFRFYAPRREKEFTSYWYNCSQEQFKIIAEEVFYWDGSIDKRDSKRFFSTSKKNVDFIQFVLASLGKRSTITEDKRKDRTTCYSVCKSQGNSTVSMVSTGGTTKAEIVEYTPKDKKQYCFTVDTGYLVLRREGRIFITGNSGKTHIMTAIAGQLLTRGISVKYYIADEIIQKLNACKYDEENYNREFSKIANAEVLFIDDLFKSSIKNYYQVESINTEDLRVIFQIINYRYNKNKPILLSSEITDDRFAELDQALIGRINEMCNYENLISIAKDSKKNYRMKGRFK